MMFWFGVNVMLVFMLFCGILESKILEIINVV